MERRRDSGLQLARWRTLQYIPTIIEIDRLHVSISLCRYISSYIHFMYLCPIYSAMASTVSTPLNTKLLIKLPGGHDEAGYPTVLDPGTTVSDPHTLPP